MDSCAHDSEKPEYSVVFNSSPDDYPWRIPSMAKFSNGDIIALGGKLLCGNDVGNGRCDIFARISKDNGKTWGETILVAEGTGEIGVLTGGNDGSNETEGYGDAAIVIDKEKDKILIICATGSVDYSLSKTQDLDYSKAIRIARIYGKYEDDSLTFSQPEDITHDIYSLVPCVNTGIFVASGNICQSNIIRKGSANRIYMSLTARNFGNYVVYSDDFGMSWNVLGDNSQPAHLEADEAKCAELPNGDLLLSGRVTGCRLFNIYRFYSLNDGTGRWDNELYSKEGYNGIEYGSNRCNGELLCIEAIRNSDGANTYLVLQSVPTGDKREDLAIFYKEINEISTYSTLYDFCSNWYQYLVHEGKAGYSTLCQTSDGMIGIYYEANETRDTHVVKHQDGSSFWGVGYDLVYEQLSLESITGGQFSVKRAPITTIQSLYKIQTFNGKPHSVNGIKLNCSTLAHRTNKIVIRNKKKYLIR